MIKKVKEANFQTYLIHSDNRECVLSDFKKEKDWHVFQYEFLDIKDMRELSTFFSTKLEGKSYVVSFDNIDIHAQNLFLKLLEELDPASKFVFVVPIGFKIIATINSRINLTLHDETQGEEEEDTLSLIKGIESKMLTAKVGDKEKASNLKRLHKLARNGIVTEKNLRSVFKMIS